MTTEPFLTISKLKPLLQEDLNPTTFCLKRQPKSQKIIPQIKIPSTITSVRIGQQTDIILLSEILETKLFFSSSDILRQAIMYFITEEVSTFNFTLDNIPINYEITMSFKIPKPFLNKIDQYSEQHGISRTQLARKSIKAFHIYLTQTNILE